MKKSEVKVGGKVKVNQNYVGRLAKGNGEGIITSLNRYGLPIVHLSGYKKTTTFHYRSLDIIPDDVPVMNEPDAHAVVMGELIGDKDGKI